MEENIRNALIRVYDHRTVVDFAKTLRALGNWRIVALKETAALLEQHDVPVTYIERFIGFRPFMSDAVKVYSPQILCGLEARTTEELTQLKSYGYPSIDLCYVELHPSLRENEVSTDQPAPPAQKADVAGRALLSAAAQGRRIVLSDPVHEKEVLDWLKAGEPDKEKYLERLATLAESTVATYSLLSANQISGIEISIQTRGFVEPQSP